LNGDARLPLAVQDRVSNGRRPAVPGQKRGVDVEATTPRNPKDPARQTLAISDDHQHVRRRVPNPRRPLRQVNALRLNDGQPVPERQFLHGRRIGLASPPRGPVGLGHDQTDLVPARRQSGERWNGEIRSADEDEFHANLPIEMGAPGGRGERGDVTSGMFLPGFIGGVRGGVMLACQIAKLGRHNDPGGGAQAVHEKAPLQMIQFMLPGARGQSIRFHLHLLAVKQDGAHLDVIRAPHFAKTPGTLRQPSSPNCLPDFSIITG